MHRSLRTLTWLGLGCFMAGFPLQAAAENPFGAWYSGGPGGILEACEQSHVVASGAGAVRVDLRWSTVQPKPTDPIVLAGRSYKIMQKAQLNGLGVQIVLRAGLSKFTTEYRLDHPSEPCNVPDGLEYALELDCATENCFRDRSNVPIVRTASGQFIPGQGYFPDYWTFVNTVVGDLVSEGISIEYIVVENEAGGRNGDNESWGGTPEDYRKLLETAADAVHAVDPNLKVADSGLGSEWWAYFPLAWYLHDGEPGVPSFPSWFPGDPDGGGPPANDAAMRAWLLDYLDSSSNACWEVERVGSGTFKSFEQLEDDLDDPSGCEAWEYMLAVREAVMGTDADIDAINLHMYDDWECAGFSCAEQLVALLEGFVGGTPVEVISNEFGKVRRTAFTSDGDCDEDEPLNPDDLSGPMSAQVVKSLVTAYGAGLDYIGWFRMDTCADCPKYCKVPLTEIPSCYTSDCDCDDGTPAGTTTYTACDPGDETQGWPWPDDLTYFETYYAYQDFVTRVVDDDLQPAPLEVDGAVWRYHFQPPGDPLAENIYFWIQGKSLSNITIDAPNDPNVYGFRVYDMFGNQVQAGFLQNGQAIMPPSGNPRRLIWKYFGAQHPFLSAVDPDGVIEAGHSVLSLVSTEAAGRIDSNVEDRALVSAEVDAQGRLNLRIAGFEHEEIYLDRVSISPIAPTQDEVSLDAALTSTGEPVHDDVTGAHVEAFHSEPDAGALPLEFADGEFAVIRPGQFVDLQVATELAPGTEARVLVELEGHYHVLSDAEESSDTSTPVRLSVRPSPFRAETTIALQASRSSPVDVVVYGVDGRRVRVFRNVTVPALRWDGRDTRGQDVAPGVYFVRAHSGEATSTVRAVKLR